MDEVLSERRWAAQAYAAARQQYAERHRAAQAPPPPVIPSPAPTVGQASRLCNEYTFWRGEMQGFACLTQGEQKRYSCMVSLKSEQKRRKENERSVRWLK